MRYPKTAGCFFVEGSGLLPVTFKSERQKARARQLLGCLPAPVTLCFSHTSLTGSLQPVFKCCLNPSVPEDGRCSNVATKRSVMVWGLRYQKTVADIHRRYQMTLGTMKPSVCIIRVDKEFEVDKELLQARNLTVRCATDCLADLILSNAGLTVAYILLKASMYPFTDKQRARCPHLGVCTEIVCREH